MGNITSASLNRLPVIAENNMEEEGEGEEHVSEKQGAVVVDGMDAKESNKKTVTLVNTNRSQTSSAAPTPTAPFGLKRSNTSPNFSARQNPPLAPINSPRAVPDSQEPIFGLHDASSNEKLAEKDRREREVKREVVEAARERKKEAILMELLSQKEEEEMLKQVKKEFCEDN